MKDYIEERAVEIAGYIIETNATVRQAAKKFGISKSTTHKDCTERLSQINPRPCQRQFARCCGEQAGKTYSWWSGYQGEIFAPSRIKKCDKI